MIIIIFLIISSLTFFTHPFRQDYNLTHSPNVKHYIYSFTIQAHHLIPKRIVDIEGIHPDGQKVQAFQIVQVQIPPKLRPVGDKTLGDAEPLEQI